MSAAPAGLFVGPAWRAVFSDDRVYRYVLRRDIGMLHGSSGTVTFVLHRIEKASLKDVGAVLVKDHSSILSGVRRFDARLAVDEVLRRRIQAFAANGTEREAA